MKTVLVVDDELAIADMLCVVLEGEGYRVVTASNGQVALASLTMTRPDMVLCDLMMPLLDGQELCRAMKSDPQYQAIPIILMSAVGDSLISAATQHDGFIGKPFDIDEVLALVERLIGKPDERSGLRAED
jgi:CheY-like chemotaxis protein